MTQEDIHRIARELYGTGATEQEIRFAILVAAAQREKLTHWMRNLGYATHGGTMEEMLDHLGTQIAEVLDVQGLFSQAMEREACADICDQHASVEGIAQRCAEQIRARSKT
jgi:hypothetical protein